MRKRFDDVTQSIVDKFDTLYYNSGAWIATKWLGVSVQKIVSDLWVYQEIIFELKPDVIIETGTYNGGSALFMASMCDLVKKGKVITIDVSPRQTEDRPVHDRIHYILGSSTDTNVFSSVKKHIKEGDKVLVVLDSNHETSYVFQEMLLYWELVSIGSYLIVEDTNLGGNPVYHEFGPGPMMAVKEFLKTDIGKNKFVVDYNREKFFITWNPGGYLKRVQ